MKNAQTKKVRETIGQILPVRSLLARIAHGSATQGNNRYEIAVGWLNGAPMIQSKQTGKWFVLDWQTIVKLAQRAGIDKPEKTVAADVVRRTNKRRQVTLPPANDLDPEDMKK